MKTTDLPTSQLSPAQQRIRRLRTAGYFATILMIGLVAAIIGPAIPGLAENVGGTLAALGSLFTVRSLGGILGSLLSGRLYDRLPGHSILVVTMLLLAATIAAVPLAGSLWILWVFIFFTGLGESFLDVGVNSQLIWTYRQHSAPYLNALHFFFGIGALLAPLLYVQVVSGTGQLNWAFWILSLTMLPVAVWNLFVPGPQIQKAAADEPEARFNKAIFLICLMFFLYVGAEVSYGGWIYTYALQLELADIVAAGYLNSAFWGMLTIGRLLAIPAAVYVPPGRLLLAAIVGCLVSLAGLWLFSGNTTILWLGTLGLGFCMAPVFPTLLALAGRRLTLTGQVTGWFFIASNAGGMSIPWLSGVLIQEADPLALIWLLAAVLGAALFSLSLLNRMLPGKKSLSHAASA